MPAPPGCGLQLRRGIPNANILAEDQARSRRPDEVRLHPSAREGDRDQGVDANVPPVKRNLLIDR
eukprot:3461871-Prymnesium_polylepis.1